MWGRGGAYRGPGPSTPPRYQSLFLGDQDSADRSDPLPPFDPLNTQGLSWDGYSSDSEFDSRSYHLPQGFGRHRSPSGRVRQEIQEYSRTQPRSLSPRRLSEEWAYPPYNLPISSDSRSRGGTTGNHSTTMLPYRDPFVGPSRRPDYSAGPSRRDPLSSLRSALRSRSGSRTPSIRRSVSPVGFVRVYASSQGSGRREPSVYLLRGARSASNQQRPAGWGNRAFHPLDLMGPGPGAAPGRVSTDIPDSLMTATSGGWGWGFLGGGAAQNRQYVGERDTASSRMLTEQELAQRELYDQMGRLEVGRSQSPFVYPREPYRWAGEPDYGNHPRSPRRRRSGWDWEHERTGAPEFSDETTHYSQEAGSVIGQPNHGCRRNRLHPHFGTIGEDQRYGVGGRRWINPNPPGLHTPLVMDVMDDNFSDLPLD